MKKTSLAKFIFVLFIAIQIIFLVVPVKYCFATQDDSPYTIKPWSVGQFVVYEIISFEGEDADNRYRISLVGEEKINGRKYFWEKIDIWESIVTYGHNKINKELVKNISFKALVPPEDTDSFKANPAAFISKGVFPVGAAKLSVQIDGGPWQSIEPKDFFDHQNIIEDTPYSITPHAKGRINFPKLKLGMSPQSINSPAGTFYCYRFSVDTKANEEYWDEGFDLWRSKDVPILGLVKMEFSKTLFWEKWKFRNQHAKITPGRMRPDSCTIALIDYGPK